MRTDGRTDMTKLIAVFEALRTLLKFIISIIMVKTIKFYFLRTYL
jgi:hypothetical protein